MTKKRSSGEKLFRINVVGVRLDPKLKYAAELAARKQRRTLSSFIEWAVQEAVSKVPVTKQHTAEEAMDYVWDVADADRFVKTAVNLPDLLTHDEEVTWKLIEDHPAMWRGKRDSKGGSLAQVRKDQANNFRFGLLEEHFETFEKVAKGEMDKKALEKIKPST